LTLLDEIIERVTAGGLQPDEHAGLAALVARDKPQAWYPSPGPQTDAYFSKADLLLYGGQGGGGKSSLLLGLALTAHQRSLIMRRQYADLGALTEEAVRFNGSRDGFNNSSPPRLRTADGRHIDFGAAKNAGDEQHWQGNPHDFIGFDETVQFLESQVRFVMGWNRPLGDEGSALQRSRVVMASNPPVTAEGQWIVGMFRPWLDPTYHRPAKSGELRWFVTDPDGKDLEVPDGTPMQFPGTEKVVIPKTRTFIPAALADNPFYASSGYQATLDALPEPLRSAIRDGNFMAARRDAPNQIIPNAWVIAAVARGREISRPPRGVPMCAIGVDASGGGDDPMILAPRYDGWFAPLIEIPGSEIPMDKIGKFSAGVIVQHRKDACPIILDMGGGYGGPAYEHLKENEVPVTAWKGAEATQARTKDRRLSFWNKRTMALWRFREALDPSQDGGSPIILPDDPLLVADLCAPTFEVTPRGIKAETKEDVCKRLGRSTDRGDAVVMAWQCGEKIQHRQGGWIEGGDPAGEMGGRRKTHGVVNTARAAAHALVRRG
jgi:hypothetical protein